MTRGGGARRVYETRVCVRRVCDKRRVYNKRMYIYYLLGYELPYNVVFSDSGYTVGAVSTYRTRSSSAPGFDQLGNCANNPE